MSVFALRFSQVKLQNSNRVRSVQVTSVFDCGLFSILEEYSRHIPHPASFRTGLRTRQIQRLWSDSRRISQIIKRVWIRVCQDRAVDAVPFTFYRDGEWDGG